MGTFGEACKLIVSALSFRATESKLGRDELIKFAYNEAMDDACNFVKSMAKSNPQHRLVFTNLLTEMRHWLPLRSDD